MTDWYLCDGRNGAPDLRGLFITGRHPESVDYNSIGKQGGNNKLKLTIDQMPYHTHLGL
jgi:microcystin-dependent protein